MTLRDENGQLIYYNYNLFQPDFNLYIIIVGLDDVLQSVDSHYTSGKNKMDPTSIHKWYKPLGI